MNTEKRVALRKHRLKMKKLKERKKAEAKSKP